MKTMLKNVRLSFPTLFKPETFGGEGDPVYSASFIFPPGSDAAKAIEAAIEDAAKEKWAGKAKDVLKALRAAGKICLHDGDAKEYDGYAGNLYVSARSKTRPTLLNRDKTPVAEADGVLYGGCYVNALLDVWAQDNAFGKRINATLKGVQFVRDGDAFGGGAPASADDFPDESEAEDDANDLF
ncbi:MAG: hypothetical protein AzoDbin1_05155 [Azoarcus sp.]|nr:hypothetical protein [Azoarcus sp.]